MGYTHMVMTDPITTTDPSAIALVEGIALRKVIVPITKYAPQNKSSAQLRLNHPLPTSVVIDLDRP